MGRALLVLETQADRQKAVTWIGKAPEGTRVEFKASKRSLPQNDLMWALLTEFSQKFQHGGKKYDPTEWKCIFLHAFGREISFLPSLDGKTFLPIEMSSSDLSKQEMTDFIEFILREAAERGVVLQMPKDTNSEASSPSEPADAPPPDASAAADDFLPSSSAAPIADEGSKTGLLEPHTVGGGEDIAPSSANLSLSPELIVHFKDFARKGLKTAGEDLPENKRIDLIENMLANYRDVVPEPLWGKLATIKVSLQAVIAKKRTVDQARKYLAMDLLDCDISEIGG
jgi:hypothetical protein